MNCITVRKEMDFDDLLRNSWSGAKDVLLMLEEKNLEDEAMQVLSEIFDEFGEIPTETQVNDFIWFEMEDVMKEWGYLQEEEEEEED